MGADRAQVEIARKIAFVSSESSRSCQLASPNSLLAQVRRGESLLPRATSGVVSDVLKMRLCVRSLVGSFSSSRSFNCPSTLTGNCNVVHSIAAQSF